jgi:hypothetical protein
MSMSYTTRNTSFNTHELGLCTSYVCRKARSIRYCFLSPGIQLTTTVIRIYQVGSSNKTQWSASPSAKNLELSVLTSYAKSEMSDSEQLRLAYEGVVKQNPSNVEAVHYLAVWHLERHSFQQVTSFSAT